MSQQLDQLAKLLFVTDNSNAADVEAEWRAAGGQQLAYIYAMAEALITAGYRQVFDGDCGLSSVEDESDREAAEAWMRFSNIVLGNDHDGIAAMKQMLTEFGYLKQVGA